ncbi:FAD dependent oxidoreductase [Lentinus tigrinus ALCF2SS1-6]|uniref:FAD dependent oxidoreductase n=1 Tax=Lentinus tigrinus ALCF2SS1-6 TaxID=1328759 RepID=A0A5C2S1N4_9APHY|nr:FAD dependent oxidoreductase [Lentinus tigrinus ALCF2SS1-6]
MSSSFTVENAVDPLQPTPVPVEPVSKPIPLPVPNSTQSFWLDPEANPLAKAGSTGPLTSDVDICIIGSGITGVSAAYHLTRLLAERGAVSEVPNAQPLKIVILEARDFCECTITTPGRNGGHLTPVYFQFFTEYVAAHGTEDAVRAIALEQYVASSIVDLLHSTGQADAVDLVAGGRVYLLVSEDQEARAKADYEAAKAAGVDVSAVRFLGKEEVLETYGAPYPALWTPGHNLWPLKVVTHLYNLARQTASDSATSSLALHTNTPVTSITPIWTLSTPRGAIAASYILHATNAYASYLLPHLHGPTGIIPTRGQVLAVRTDMSTKAAFADYDGSEYGFPRPVQPQDGSQPLVIVGGARQSAGPGYEMYEADDSGMNPRFFPERCNASTSPDDVREWSGIMGFTDEYDVFVGPVIDPSQPEAHKGQYICAGYSGHGMTRAYGCAEAIAQKMVADLTAKEWDVPEWLPRHHITDRRKSSN